MLSSEGPVPVSATINVVSGAWSCTFDQALQPGPVNVANWSMRANDTDQVPSTAVAAGNVVSGASAPAFADPGSDAITWSPPPFDVVNAIGQPSFAFADFPLVVT